MATLRTLGDVLEEMNVFLDDESLALLGDPPPIERLPLKARKVLPPHDEASAPRFTASPR